MAFLSRIWSKELTAKIARGQQVGLYGIHKIGKSSLLEQMRLKLHLSNPEMTVVSIEMNDSLSEAGDLYHEIIDKLPGSVDRPDGRFVSSSIFRKELTAYHARRDRGRPGHRLLLLLDEYAYLIPDRRGRHGLKGFQEVLGLFKTLNQEGWLLVLPCGRTADLNRQASWGKDENPLIDMLHRFLGPLPREENNAMMETLGVRAKMTFYPEALAARCTSKVAAIRRSAARWVARSPVMDKARSPRSGYDAQWTDFWSTAINVRF